MSAAFTEKPVSPRLLSHREKMLLLDTIRTSDDLLFVRRSCPLMQKRPSEQATLRTHFFSAQRLLGQIPTDAVFSESAVPSSPI
jgi:hypothetical protein